jgi:hypothetical protein
VWRRARAKLRARSAAVVPAKGSEPVHSCPEAMLVVAMPLFNAAG